MALVVDIKKITVYYQLFLENIAYENAKELFHK